MGGSREEVANVFWHLFELSGLISAYLVYKEAEDEEERGEEIEEDRKAGGKGEGDMG